MYKSTWEAWARFTLALDGGDAWTFDVRKPEKGLIFRWWRIRAYRRFAVHRQRKFHPDQVLQEGHEDRGLFAGARLSGCGGRERVSR